MEAKDLSVVCVKAGDVHKALGLSRQVPNVVQVMKQLLNEITAISSPKSRPAVKART
ncbi:hypothetical protein [Oceanithermus desulfurans]|uniref:Uncharacterized protein n=1 Tax=Oceanithermus desulfurans TaxID=227924 RepID=A0ABR6P4F1_9DEIN|nr:hypothetical protein [Oceanithermus desulfurans]MBB6030730.1 hypothetical protein [Oceanithermus desulfurans]